MQFKQHWQVYPMLAKHGGMRRLKSGGYSNSYLSDGGMPFKSLPIGQNGERFMVYVVNKRDARLEQAETRKGLVYRVLVWCNCGRIIPLAKMGQHYQTKACGWTE